MMETKFYSNYFTVKNQDRLKNLMNKLQATSEKPISLQYDKTRNTYSFEGLGILTGMITDNMNQTPDFPRMIRELQELISSKENIRITQIIADPDKGPTFLIHAIDAHTYRKVMPTT